MAVVSGGSVGGNGGNHHTKGDEGIGEEWKGGREGGREEETEEGRYRCL